MDKSVGFHISWHPTSGGRLTDGAAERERELLVLTLHCLWQSNWPGSNNLAILHNLKLTTAPCILPSLTLFKRCRESYGGVSQHRFALLPNLP